jgi:hypothetical protein
MSVSMQNTPTRYSYRTITNCILPFFVFLMFVICKFLDCWINAQVHILMLSICTPTKECLISRNLKHPNRRNNATIHHPTYALLVFNAISYPTKRQLIVLELMG